MTVVERDCSEVTIAGRRLEVARLATGSEKPPIVLLHEGLGSLAAWRDFPERLAEETERDVVVYSRYGHGRSERLGEPRAVSYMHDEARIVLRELLAALKITKPVLFGHSDGASIALIYAATFPGEVEALVVEAPHVFVEPLTIESIAGIKMQAKSSDLLAKLGRYHDDAAATFTGWNDIWLHPDFRTWDITDGLAAIQEPVLLIQGSDDEYGSVAQLAAIRARVRDARTLLIDACGHNPHRAQPAQVLRETRTFLNQLEYAC
jgi:pimeloyl-ACP methyl ester carboxylesterase